MYQAIFIFILLAIVIIFIDEYEASFIIGYTPMIKPKKYRVFIKTFIDEEGNVKLRYYPMEYVFNWNYLWCEKYMFEYSTELYEFYTETLEEAITILKIRQKHFDIDLPIETEYQSKNEEKRLKNA